MNVLRKIWRALDGVRKVLHLLVLLVLTVVVLALLAPDEPRIPRDAALILVEDSANALIDDIEFSTFVLTTTGDTAAIAP